MNKLIDVFLDIETIPTRSVSHRALIAAGVKPPANMSKAETIAKWEAESRPAAVQEAIEKTSLDAAFGHVAVIGWAFGDDETTVFSAVDRDDNGINRYDAVFDETQLLTDFFVTVSDLVSASKGVGVRIIGHNVVGFDLKFVTQRAIVLGVKLPAWWPVDPKPWSDQVFDTMIAWAGSRDRISMDNLCAALDLPGKGDFDGSMVAAAWERGEFERVASYCADDVRKVRAVARRILAVLPARS